MRVRTGSHLRFGELLAAQADSGPVRPAQVAREVDAPLSTINEWLRQLRFQRALLTAPQGEIVDRTRLLQFYAATRMARLYPVKTFQTTLTSADLSQALRRESVPHALAMLSAANEWAFFEPRRRVEIYLGRGDISRVTDLVPQGGGVAVDVFAENVAELPVETRGRAVFTNAFLTIIDCRAHPEGGAHAHFLEQSVMRWND
jgi:transposase-like protein